MSGNKTEGSFRRAEGWQESGRRGQEGQPAPPYRSS